MTRTALILILILTLAGFPAASGDSGPSAGAEVAGLSVDPALPGPFGVGLWETTIPRHVGPDGRPQPLPLMVWYPTEGRADAPSASGPFPLVMFSHGASSSPDVSAFLSRHLATHGFVVGAVQHPKYEGLDGRGRAFAARPAEAHAAVDFLLAQAARSQGLLSGTIDPAHLGVTGHSFGGLTTIALLGEEWSRFEAGIPMAPGIRPGDPADVSDRLGQIRMPVMFMMGQADTLALYENVKAGYAQVPKSTERYALVFPAGTHLTYSDHCSSLGPCPRGTLNHDLGHRLVARQSPHESARMGARPCGSRPC